MHRTCSCKGSQLPRAEDASRALAIFGRLLEARDLDDWRPSHVLLVEQLANTHAQADRVTQEIETTGWVIPSPKNPEQKIRNPLLDASSLNTSYFERTNCVLISTGVTPLGSLISIGIHLNDKTPNELPRTSW